jgi:hypothetical protein
VVVELVLVLLVVVLVDVDVLVVVDDVLVAKTVTNLFQTAVYGSASVETAV